MAFVIVLALVAALYLFMIAPCGKRPDASALRGWKYAHRGLHDGNVNVPENSMRAFELAVENGYGMELDVQLTKDGQLVVHHDGTLERVCGVNKALLEMDYADLPLLPDGSRIPLLKEVLDMVDGRTPIIVEIKYYGGAARIAAAAHEVLKGYQGAYCVESFHPLAVQYFRKHAPHIVRGQLASGGKWDKAVQSYISYVALKYLLVNVAARPHFVAYSVPEDNSISIWLMKKLFKPMLACWTVRDQKTLDYARKQGYEYPIFELVTPDK